MIFDTLTNVVAGLFGSKDKLAQDRFGFFAQDRQQLEAAYRGDWISRKVIDVPPFDMTREWRDWQADKPQIAAIEAEEERLGVQQKVNRALRLARLYGGSALVLGIGDSDPTQPLPAIEKEGLRYLHVMNRWEITPGEVDRDVLSPLFGEPKWYQVASTGKSLRLHPSRVVRFLGAELPDWQTAGADGWGDSSLQAVMDAIKHAGLATQGVAMLIHEAKLDVIRIPSLSTSLSSKEYASRLVDRFTLANTMKGLVNALVIDKEEEWDRKQISFAQLPEIMQQYLQIAAGAADIPATRLLGQAPAGLNATGEGDIRNYYDRISAEQRVTLTPNLRRLDEALIMSAIGTRPDEIHFNWAPLWQLSDTEKAAIAYQKAQTAQIEVSSGLVPPQVMATIYINRLVEDATYPGVEGAMADYAKLAAVEKVAGPDDPEAAADPNTPPGRKPAAGRRQQQDAAPRTLYVRRDVVNADDVIAWAKAQGIPDLRDGLHVTIASSRTPLDWMKIDGDWNSNDKGDVTVAPGGVRIVEPLGDMTAVLLFTSSTLTWRHEQIIRAGATSDYPDYQPHISLTKAPLDLASIEPYRGKIVLGPEIFEAFKDDPLPGAPDDGGGPNAGLPFVEDGRGGGRGRYNPGQPRDFHGRWTGSGAGGKKVKGLVDRATSDKGSKGWLLIGSVRNHAAIKAATGYDLRGWDRKITADAIRKIFKSHGNPATEKARGQHAITRSDFKRVRSIVGKPDRISLGGQTRGGKLQALVYERRLAGRHYTVVETLQPGHRKAVLHTMYKR